MRIVTPLRLGVIGVACVAIAFVWIAIWHHTHPLLLDPQVFERLDEFPPRAPVFLGRIGFVVTLVAVTWALVGWVRRKT